MASVNALSIDKVAIPATYWADKFIEHEKWYQNKDNMYYEGKVESSYYNNKTKTNNYKIRLLVTHDIVWLKDNEVESFDLNKMPFGGQLVTESNGSSSEDDTDDDVNLALKKPRRNKKRKVMRTISTW